MLSLNDFIDSVLVNNPVAVSENLASQGVVNQGEWLDPQGLKQVLFTEFVNRKEFGAAFVAEMLDVPVDPDGEQAAELTAFYNQGANKNALVQALQTPAPGGGVTLKLPAALSWKTAFAVLGITALVLLNIFLFKKIFFRHDS